MPPTWLIAKTAFFRKRREFWGGAALTIAAGLIAAGFLVFDTVQSQSELSEVSGQLQDVTVKWRRAERVQVERTQLRHHHQGRNDRMRAR